MRYVNAPDLIARVPSVITAVLVTGFLRPDPEREVIEARLRRAEEEVRGAFRPETLSAHPHVAAWRRAYSAFGVKPSQYHAAHEALVRRVLKEGALPRIHPLVDACNAVALRAILPVAAYDRHRLRGDLVVRLAHGQEEFVPLGGGPVEHPMPGEIVYTDGVVTGGESASGIRALSRRWNWRQADGAKVTAATGRALITIEGVFGIERGVVEEAAADLAILLGSGWGCGVTAAVLTAERPAADFVEDVPGREETCSVRRAPLL